MPKANAKVVSPDLNKLIKDAQELFQTAATLTGDKADEMRNHAMALLNTAQDKAQKMPGDVVAAGKEAVAAASGYVKENPWRAVATAGGVGTLLGLIAARR
jgi:ElaB/YqjD/DUF883 family membrane-anchored ribosome-binding protein